jgi:hypothetical protein
MRYWSTTQNRSVVVSALAAVLVVYLVVVSFPRNIASTTNGVLPTTVNGYTTEASKYAPTAAYEQEAVDAALATVKSGAMTQLSKPADKVLCVTFIQLSLQSIENSVNNTAGTETDCHWVYLVYRHEITSRDTLLSLFQARLQGVHGLSHEILFAPRRTEALAAVTLQCQMLLQSKNYETYKLEETCTQIGAAQHGTASLTGNYNHLVYPKVVLFTMLLPKLTAHTHVWIVDGDISLEGFRVRPFLQTARCAFSTPALVAQPLIAQSTQTYKYFNLKSWNALGSKQPTNMRSSTVGKKHQPPIAAQTGFIEIQVPLIESRFFEWYILKVVMPLAVPMHVLGADWGFDEIFCRSAQFYYAATIAAGDGSLAESQGVGYTSGTVSDAVPDKRSVPSKAARNRANETGGDTVNTHLLRFLQRVPTQCAVILPQSDAGSVQHGNSRETNALLGYDTKKALNDHMRRIVRTAFPTFYMVGKGPRADPLHPETKLKRSYELRAQCGGQ